MLAALRDRPDDIWWDRQGTPERERRDDILRLALGRAWVRVRSRDGFGPDTTGWRWDRMKTARIPHIAFFPGLGREGISVTGGNGTLSPLAGTGTHGASWRMVVDLAPHPMAWTTYPGGQSGDPASARYDDRIGEWQRGELEPALLPRSPEELTPVDRSERVRFVTGTPVVPRGPWSPRWWSLALLGVLMGSVAARRGLTAWWGALLGAVTWGGVLLATWEPGATLRLVARLGALFGGTPSWMVLLVVPLWGGMLTGIAAKATKSVMR